MTVLSGLSWKWRWLSLKKLLWEIKIPASYSYSNHFSIYCNGNVTDRRLINEFIGAFACTIASGAGANTEDFSSFPFRELSLY